MSTKAARKYTLDELVNLTEASHELRMSSARVRQLVHAGKLVAVRDHVGRRYVVRESILALIKERIEQRAKRAGAAS
jgi:hypothetical protein